MNSEYVFTSSALLHFLSEIEELSDKTLTIDETGSGVVVTIGENSYALESEWDAELSTTEDDAEMVQDIAIDEYQDLSESADLLPVDSGILSGIAKSLLLGGMLKLAPKLLK